MRSAIFEVRHLTSSFYMELKTLFGRLYTQSNSLFTTSECLLCWRKLLIFSRKWKDSWACPWHRAMKIKETQTNLSYHVTFILLSKVETWNYIQKYNWRNDEKDEHRKSIPIWNTSWEQNSFSWILCQSVSKRLNFCT